MDHHNIISNKKDQYKKEIRRKQIDQLMAQCRSKLLSKAEEYINDAVATEALNKIVPVQLSIFDKSKVLLKMMVGTSNTEMKQQRSYSYDTKVTKQIMLLRQGQNVQLYYSDTLTVFTQNELVECVNYLSRQICMRNYQINQKIRKIIKQQSIASKNPQNSGEILVEVFNYTSDLKQVLNHLNILLQTSLDLIISMQNSCLNSKLLEAMTSCLIELSVFRHRSFSQQLNIPIVQEVNILMKQYRDILDIQTTRILQGIALQIGFNLSHIHIVINIISVLGNISVSLNLKMSEGKQMCMEIQNLVFSIFQNVFKFLHLQSGDEQSNIIKQVERQFPELAALMAWFIRNQILITTGLYKQSYNEGQNKMNLDLRWQQILQTVLSEINFQAHKHKKDSLSDQNIQTILDIVAALKILRNDFDLSLNSLWRAFNSIYPLTQLAKNNPDHFQTFNEIIYEFYIEFLTQKYHDNSSFNLYWVIVNTCVNIVHKTTISVIEIKLCNKVLASVGLIHGQERNRLFLQICGNLNPIIIGIKNNKELYRQALQFLKLVQTMIEMSEAMICHNQMQFEFLGVEHIRQLLELCKNIWQIKRSSNEIIATLYFLKTLANDSRFANHLKAIILGQSYTEDLEVLSSDPCQEINYIVYEIYELLQIE